MIMLSSSAHANQSLRGELFTRPQLEVHAQALGERHKLTPRPGPDRLLRRLRENEAVLLLACEEVTKAAARGQRITPAAEWIIDNFHVVQEQIETTRHHLPRSYSRQLPQLASGALAGYPRIYHLAAELVSHLDGQIDNGNLSAFIAAYQRRAALKLGELWAVPIMLRLALIEYLREIAGQIISDRRERDLANHWAEGLMAAAQNNPAGIVVILADMTRTGITWNRPFVAEIWRLLQGKHPALALPLAWIEHRLAEQSLNIEELLREEAQKNTIDQISIGNSISSLRALNAADWRAFVESLSMTEKKLREDPAGVYAAMDFATRDRYRHAVERLAKLSRQTEEGVAAMAVQLAARSGFDPRDAAQGKRHVGYYLVDAGLPQLIRELEARPTIWDRVVDLLKQLPLGFYLGGILAVTAGAMAGFTALVPWAAPWAKIAGSIALLLTASQLAVAVVQWIASVVIPPRPIPRLDFSRGVPADCKTVVAIPTMLTSATGITDLLESLEVRFVANRDPQICFALLTDFRDAPAETMEGDEALLSQACQGVEALNAKYAALQPQAFYLFHRSRRWNPAEGCWMGYERKRGKLAEFNQFLVKGAAAGFTTVVGDTTRLLGTRFVITLDTDTELPRDAARELIATMAHPLVRPVYDTATRCISHGYGVLQPHVAISLPSASRSWFARIFAGDPGLDPYTGLVSDAYQDIFDEGSFVGKGIYEVAVFEKILGARFPENRILSHDLLEGCHVRTGLVTDVQVYEEHPWHYTADAARKHRWVRGDWQIATWLLPRVPGPDARSAWNQLSGLSRWKILDNLRRSLVPAAILLLLSVSWLAAPAPLLATCLIAVLLTLPPLLATVIELAHKPHALDFATHAAAVARRFGRQLAQLALTLVFLPFDACVCLDAVGRTLWRLLVTHRRLLEWQTASDSLQYARQDLASFYRTMAAAPLLAIMLQLLLQRYQPASLPTAEPWLMGWLLSPAIAWWISRPLVVRQQQIPAEHRQWLFCAARRTWAFFDVFMCAENHYLPPDNFQEQPREAVAHRTSPTNIGMGLGAVLAAYDFGYLSVQALVARLGQTLGTLVTLARYHRHFFNWYDTRTLHPLAPLYVSTVDSGNLAALLLVVRQGLLEIPEHRLLSPRAFAGLNDMVLVLGEQLAGLQLAQREGWPVALEKHMAEIHRELAHAPAALPDAVALLGRLAEQVAKIVQLLSAPEAAAAFWAAQALQAQVQEIHDSLLGLAPWLPLRHIWAKITEPSWREKLQRLEANLSLREVAQAAAEVAAMLESSGPETGMMSPADKEQLRRALLSGAERCQALGETAGMVAAQCEECAQMEFGFLYDETRKQMAIGFNVTDRRRDNSFYDLLASEARLASFVAIALGQLPQEHWFALGRRLTTAGGGPVLLSWSGSMFEYLMPLLVMPSYAGTLLDRTCAVAVRRQIQYGRERKVPWGISESGYNMTDVQLNYQYRAFGVPGLGFKRGLAEDLVVAPYASAMALMVDAEPAFQNLQRLAAAGLQGRYGFYEAVDYTPQRLPPGQDQAVVCSFLAHHQGMSLLSYAAVLLDSPMQRRFLAEPLFRATDLLLQERVPTAARVALPPGQAEISRPATAIPPALVRAYSTPATPAPEVQVLSNAVYHVMVSAAGGGYSRWNDLAITRWQEDPTCDSWGSFCYIRDLASGTFWSATHQPTLKPADEYQVNFEQARADFRRRDGDITTRLEISVAPEDDVEVRRVRLTNHSSQPRAIDLTTYAEVVLMRPLDAAAHPAFGNLFVETQLVRQRRAILCTRRPRSQQEKTFWMFHLLALEGEVLDEASFETDRSKFIGHARTLAAPAALQTGELSGSAGAVLDPIVSIRQKITLPPDAVTSCSIITGMAKTREAALEQIEKYCDFHLADRVFEMAHTHNQLMRRQLNITAADSELYAYLAGAIVYSSRWNRASAAVLGKNRRPQSALWSYGISGDLPLVLLRVGEAASLNLVRQVIQAHAYWRRKGLAVDLLIWNEDRSGYRQDLHQQMVGLIEAGPEAHAIDRPGGIFLRRTEQIPPEDQILIQTMARLTFAEGEGTLVDQATKRPQLPLEMPRLAPRRRPIADGGEANSLGIEERVKTLRFFNGRGGFTQDGKEYIIITPPNAITYGAPWVNVLANPNFGTVISESGSAYTWAENAHEYRLTPWSNDPVSDGSGEAYYIRDEETGDFWSPTPLPARGQTPYVTRHGMGYSVFEHEEDGLRSELTIYVAPDAPVKFALLKIHNHSRRRRRLSVTGYWEWVLGDLRGKSMMHVVTEVDVASRALLARNPYNSDFSNRVAFVDVNEPGRAVSGDRREFIGRNGSLAAPAALSRSRLSGRVGAGYDPCAALQTFFELADQDQHEVVFVLGAGRNTEEARQLAQRYCTAQAARENLEAVWTQWKDFLGSVQIETPEPAVNLLANVWLPYQTLACRLWARSGFYQSGGAFGFRDQLQDAMALTHQAPHLLREHLLRCAGRQYGEGDVQHWWHPPLGRGVRTHISDDLLWLPLATCRYVTMTNDTGVLDERVTFLEGLPVKPGEEAHYDLPARSAMGASLYEHCTRAIDHALKLGEHGLPLMGTGDWNDGMNLVGREGRGESVWLAFFLYEVLQRFAELATRKGDPSFAQRCLANATQLRENIERHAWDGQWYRRAYFDNGEPLGSATNTECQIDSLPQSWAVISGAGDAVRARHAMAEVEARLVKREAGLIQLFAPPLDHSALDPGYIKGYVPGVRENGGQYTHAAVWTIMAFAMMGEWDKAWELLRLINPILHAETAEKAAVYKVEPYVAAADVYAVPPHTGRGGWTWYTGSAGWMYRLLMETLLGLSRTGDQLRIEPRLPRSWPGFQLRYRYFETYYQISVTRTAEPLGNVTVDGLPVADAIIQLVNDKAPHQVVVEIAGGPPAK